jgi:transposase InsO family protein
MKSKSEVYSTFKEFEASVTNLAGETVVALRSDNDGEYSSKEFKEFLTLKGIQHQCTDPFTPEQNGVSENE